MMAPIMSAENKRWQRQDDARTLAMAQEIMSNKARHNGAVKEAKVMAREDEKRAKAMKQVASKKIKRKTVTKKRTTKSTKNKTKKR
jgi:hypothetical protein